MLLQCSYSGVALFQQHNIVPSLFPLWSLEWCLDNRPVLRCTSSYESITDTDMKRRHFWGKVVCSIKAESNQQKTEFGTEVFLILFVCLFCRASWSERWSRSSRAKRGQRRQRYVRLSIMLIGSYWFVSRFVHWKPTLQQLSWYGRTITWKRDDMNHSNYAQKKMLNARWESNPCFVGPNKAFSMKCA